MNKTDPEGSESSTCETLFEVGRDSAALGDCNVTVACVGEGGDDGNDNERGEGTVVVRGANRFVRGEQKVARWQNLISSFPWIAPGWRVG